MAGLDRRSKAQLRLSTVIAALAGTPSFETIRAAFK
jgi:hypothetical protein